jgi:hypothetical protein
MAATDANANAAMIVLFLHKIIEVSFYFFVLFFLKKVHLKTKNRFLLIILKNWKKKV